MSIRAHELLDTALAEGVSLSELAAALAARMDAVHQTDAHSTDDRAAYTYDTAHEAPADPRTTIGAETGPAASTLPVSTPERADTAPIHGLTRYTDLGLLGTGGMGEVRRVWDRRLGRTLAMKTTHPRVRSSANLQARFQAEAQATAQLQHPGIVPIHDLGELPDGRLWFTMKEVSGQTFRQVIQDVHAVSPLHWTATSSGWTLRRLIDALRQACLAVGYAHSRGVVHRDLKPDNIMVGRHGEVLVLDWGIARVLGESATTDPKEQPVQTERTLTARHRTLMGQVAGTPAYMSPEQARGLVDRVDARSDVYSLGAILYEVLRGRPPFAGDDALEVLEKARHSTPEVLPRQRAALAPAVASIQDHQGHRAIPAPLVDACERAMHRDADARFPTAGAFAEELAAWLDGARKRDEARAVVDRATAREPESKALRAQAALLRQEAVDALEGVASWEPEARKHAGWHLEDEAEALEQQADLNELAQEQLLQASLSHDPELPEAHAALARRYREAHAAAEQVHGKVSRLEALLHRHTLALPDTHPDRIDHLHYLSGDGALTLHTDPPGAEVLLYRYERIHRRLQPQLLRSLGPTPLDAVSIARGSYLCLLKHPERAPVRYPVHIGRGAHWDGVPPEGGAAYAIPLPHPSELGPDDCYIPAGWFQCGGDPHEERCLTGRRVWVDGRIFRRFPVTTREYLLFLDDLVAQGRSDEALQAAPRERVGSVEEQGALIFGFDGTRFHLRPDAEGDIWDPGWPVSMVDWYGAQAFARWEAERTGQPWRLPGELAWEKAARGVDGRYFPWGDWLDPTWTSMRFSQQGRTFPTVVGHFPVDSSPYGVQDMAGSAADWCADDYEPDGPSLASARRGGPTANMDTTARRFSVGRGGAWTSGAPTLRVSRRLWNWRRSRFNDLSFRLARPFPAD